MKDRVPANPGRVLITPENGAAAFYATMSRADNPTQEGDPLNKNTLLKDATAALYGLGNTAVPDDVLALIKTLVNNAQSSADSRAKIETGNYAGNGQKSKTLTFSGNPKVVIIMGVAGTTYGDSMAFVRGYTGSAYVYGSSSTSIYYTSISWGDNSITLTAANASTSFNISGKNYSYVAIC